jgi:putative mRNA 3-end processing factor
MDGDRFVSRLGIVDMVKISFMGGTHEVGRNAVLVSSNEAKLLLEYGVKVGEPTEFPAHIRAREIDGIVVAHAHLDHSGGVPMFYLSEKKPFFSTATTADLCKILIEDMIKLNNYYLPFEYIELDNMLKQRNDLAYGQEVRLKDINFQLHNAGHIPGSAMVDIEINGKNILYTSDFNAVETRICSGAIIPKKKYDAVIIEATYATHEHPERKQLEVDFVKAVKDVVNDGGKVLIPAFAVGRSQEMYSILFAHGFPGLVVLDGMARSVNRVLFNHSEGVKTPQQFEQASLSVQEIRGWRDRRKALNNANVIVAPSGMLQGGTAFFYMEKLSMDPKNAVFLVSFQVPGTNGSTLLEKGTFLIGEKEQKVAAKVRHFDFSSHSGQSYLQNFLKGLKGKPDIYVIHGESESCEFLAQYAQDELGLKGTAPKEGDEFEI